MADGGDGAGLGEEVAPGLAGRLDDGVITYPSGEGRGEVRGMGTRGSGCLIDPGEDSPPPGEQLLEALGRVLSDAGQHVSQPGLRIDLVELGRHDQRRNGGSSIGASFGAGEQP